MRMDKVTIRRGILGLTMGLALVALSACQSSEEKAEGHFTSGMALLEAGDTDRALVEFRNVFQLNGQHREARQVYARIQRERGNLREAYGQYLRLVEQYPDDLEGNMALAEMAMVNGNWDDAEIYARRAIEIDPANPLAVSLGLVADYRVAFLAKDEAAITDIVTKAGNLLAANPDLVTLRKFLAEELLRRGDVDDALALVDEGLARDPSVEDFYTLRLAVLYQKQDTPAITEHLEAMVARKPDDLETGNMLIAWYLAQNDAAAAETAIRDRIDPADDALEPRLQLVQFLAEVKGMEAARAEIDALLAATPESPHVALYRSMLAGFDFDSGKRDDAITAMQQIVADHPESPQIDTIRVALAQMMTATGNEVGARAMVEEVLAADPTEVAALKLKAAWLIEDDRTGDALVALRTALEQDPRDADVMTLMARAHERDGSTDLMVEMLALAVEASGQGAAESLRYAAVLQMQDKNLPAEDALLSALRRDPQNVTLLGALGGLYLQMKDWGRAGDVIRTLEGSEGEEAQQAAQVLQARLLAASGQEQELTQYLQSLTDQQIGPAAEMALVEASVARGEFDAALARIIELETRFPDLPQVQLLEALVLLSADRGPEATEVLEALNGTHPEFEQGWLALVNLHTATGDTAAAEATLAASLEALPGSRTLKWVKAGMLERNGDIDAAIAVYEELYAEDSNWSVVANNLASLLANTRADPESLERAYVIARRLRGSTEPAFQDTYGWIAFRRGNFDEALQHLEPAAAGLPGDLTVQYHLARVYGALDRRDEAMAILTAIDGTAPPPPPKLLADVRAEIVRIEALPPPGTEAAPVPAADN